MKCAIQHDVEADQVQKVFFIKFSINVFKGNTIIYRFSGPFETNIGLINVEHWYMYVYNDTWSEV